MIPKVFEPLKFDCNNSANNKQYCMRNKTVIIPSPFGIPGMTSIKSSRYQIIREYKAHESYQRHAQYDLISVSGIWYMYVSVFKCLDIGHYISAKYLHKFQIVNFSLCIVYEEPCTTDSTPSAHDSLEAMFRKVEFSDSY